MAMAPGDGRPFFAFAGGLQLQSARVRASNSRQSDQASARTSRSQASQAQAAVERRTAGRHVSGRDRRSVGGEGSLAGSWDVFSMWSRIRMGSVAVDGADVFCATGIGSGRGQGRGVLILGVVGDLTWGTFGGAWPYWSGIGTGRGQHGNMAAWQQAGTRVASGPRQEDRSGRQWYVDIGCWHMASCRLGRSEQSRDARWRALKQNHWMGFVVQPLPWLRDPEDAPPEQQQCRTPWAPCSRATSLKEFIPKNSVAGARLANLSVGLCLVAPICSRRAPAARPFPSLDAAPSAPSYSRYATGARRARGRGRRIVFYWTRSVEALRTSFSLLLCPTPASHGKPGGQWSVATTAALRSTRCWNRGGPSSSSLAQCGTWHGDTAARLAARRPSVVASGVARPQRRARGLLAACVRAARVACGQFCQQLTLT